VKKSRKPALRFEPLVPRIVRRARRHSSRCINQSVGWRIAKPPMMGSIPGFSSSSCPSNPTAEALSWEQVSDELGSFLGYQFFYNWLEPLFRRRAVLKTSKTAIEGSNPSTPATFFGLCARIRETANWRRLERFALPGISGCRIGPSGDEPGRQTAKIRSLGTRSRGHR
jgi:hypothetical protein